MAVRCRMRFLVADGNGQWVAQTLTDNGQHEYLTPADRGVILSAQTKLVALQCSASSHRCCVPESAPKVSMICPYETGTLMSGRRRFLLLHDKQRSESGGKEQQRRGFWSANDR